MYTLFSELIKRILVSLSSILMNMARSGFKYLYIFTNEKTKNLHIVYSVNSKLLEEPLEDFLDSEYAKFLSMKQLKYAIETETIANQKATNKIFEISQDESELYVFSIKNTITNTWSHMLLQDIVSRSDILEKATASSIKVLINGVAKLSGAGMINVEENHLLKNKVDFQKEENIFYLKNIHCRD